MQIKALFERDAKASDEESNEESGQKGTVDAMHVECHYALGYAPYGAMDAAEVQQLF